MSHADTTTGRIALLRVVAVMILATAGIVAIQATATTKSAQAGTFQVALPGCGQFPTVAADGWGGGYYCGAYSATWMQLNSTAGHPVGPPGQTLWARTDRIRDGAVMTGFELNYASSQSFYAGSPNATIYLRACSRVVAWSPTLPCAGAVLDTPIQPNFASRAWALNEMICGNCGGYQINAVSGATSGFFAIAGSTVTINDFSPPGVSSQYASHDISQNKWLRGTVALGATGTDAGGGVKSVAFVPASDLTRTVTTPAGCSFAQMNPCPTSYGWAGSIDTTGLPDGTQSGHYTVTDAGNNVAATPAFTFKVDNTKPAAPASINVAGETAAGWQSINSFDVSWENAGETAETTTQSGIAKSCYDVGQATAGPDQTTDPSPVCVDGALDSLTGIEVPDTGVWPTEFYTVDRAGNASEKTTRELRYDPTRPDKPTGIANGWIGLDELRRGTDQLWSLPLQKPLADFCGIGFAVDQDAAGEAPMTITHNGNAVTSAMIPANTPEGNNYAHFRVISCAGVAGPTETKPVNVDLTNPKGTVSGIPESGWTNAPGLISAAGTDPMPGSGMDPAPEHRPVEEGASIRFSLAGTPVKEDRGASGSYDASALAEGLHELAVSTFDVARNHDDQVFSFGVDKTAPSGAFLAPRSDDPATFQVATYDALSGAAGGEIQYAPIDSAGDVGAFKSLPSSYRDGVITTTFPDTKLPNGRYALRGKVKDAATNVGYATKDQNGNPMVITTPLREPVKMTLRASSSNKLCKKRKAKSKKAKKRAAKNYKKCLKKLAAGMGSDVKVKVSYGRRSFITGRLLDKAGRPLAHQTVTLAQSGLNMPLHTVGGAKTDAAGYFAYTAPAGIMRTVYATWAGTKTQQDVTASARLKVATKVRLKVRPRAVHGKRKFKLTGKLYAAEAVLRKGKLVQLQFWNFQRRRWQAGPALVRANAKGHFSYSYRIKSVPARAERIRFRAYVPAESSWAYDTGWSNTQTIMHYRR